MALIPLTRGQYAIVDEEDYDRLMQFQWRAVDSGNSGGYYAVRGTTRRDKDGNRKYVWMHRDILKVGSGLQGDHINGNTLDNRRSNLRVASRSQNQINRSSVGSGYRGVTWHKRSGKWQAQIYHNGTCHYLGLFLTADEAHDAYKSEALIHYGEFANFNCRKKL